MKYAIMAVTALAVILGGCMLEPPIQTGSVMITIPSRASVSTDIGGVDLDFEKARVWLTSGGSRIDLENGVQFKDAVPGESIRIEGLLPDEYGVEVAFGAVTDGFMHSIVAYGDAEFSVSVGVTEQVEVLLKPQAVYYNGQSDTVGTAFVDVVTIGNDVYTLAADGTLFENGVAMTAEDLPFSEAAEDGQNLPETKIQSITTGAFFETASSVAEELWINTNNGIFPYRDGTLITDFSSGMTTPADIDSTFYYFGESESDPDSSALIFLAQGTTGLQSLQGTYVTYGNRDSPDSWTWFGWDALDEVESLSDIKQALEGVGEIVYDLELTDEYIVAATALQTLLFAKGDIEELIDYFDGLDEPATDMVLDEVLNYFTVVTLDSSDSDEGGKTIKSVEAAGDYLYLGTNTANDRTNGVFYVTVDSENVVITGADRVANTPSGYGIREIAYGESAGVAVAAAANKLFAIEDGALLKEIPSYAGLPGTVEDIEWSGRVLYVVGSEGVAHLDF